MALHDVERAFQSHGFAAGLGGADSFDRPIPWRIRDQKTSGVVVEVGRQRMGFHAAHEAINFLAMDGGTIG